MRRLVVFLTLLLPLLVVVRAEAQHPPQLSAALDAESVAVGGTVRLTLQAASDTDMPDNPHPGPTPGFVVRDVASSPRWTSITLNGVRRNDNLLTVTWLLEAQRTGSFTVGPASVMLDGKRFAMPRGLRIKVVAGDPSRPPHTPDAPDAPPDQGDAPSTDPKLALAEPRGKDAFLHAVIDKTTAVIGEPLTISVYLYGDPRSRAFLSDERDAEAPDFTSQQTDPGEPAREANVGGSIWQVRAFRRIALVPLKAGDLPVGPMSISVSSSRRTTDTRRESERFVVHVTEPPMAGRPPGYVVGDVGKFSLSAEVEPREIENGGAVSVTAHLAGAGNLPLKISPGAREGIEWLDPQVHDDAQPKTADKRVRARTFSFVVRIHKEGEVDLGDLELPYWDPELAQYVVAKASLGRVRVKPGASRSWSVASAPEQLAGLPPPRAELAGPKSPSHLADSPLFFVALGASPFAYVIAVGARAAARRWRQTRDIRAASPATELKARLEAGRAARRGSDSAAIDAAVVRAIEAASVALVGINVRGAMRDDVARRLEDGGAPEAVAREIQTLLGACEDARFSPEGVRIEHARERWDRAEATIVRLGGAS